MQTEYKLLYRFVNGTTNTPITDEAPYEKTEEFYSSEHKVNLLSSQLTAFNSKTYELNYKFGAVTEADYAATMNKEANEEREALVTSNMANENKSNNLYVYTGTTKQFHKQFVPEQRGYVVRDWTKVPETQRPDGPNDFSKHFVMLGGQKLGVDDAYLVCKPQFMSSYQKSWDIVITPNSGNKNFDNKRYENRHYKIENFTEMVNEINFFEWVNPWIEQDINYGEVAITNRSSVSQKLYALLLGNYNDSGNTYIVDREVSSQGSTTNTKYIFFGNRPFTMPATSSTLNGASAFKTSAQDQTTHYGVNYNTMMDTLNPAGTEDKDMIYVGSKIVFDKDTIIRAIIPEHYEDTGKPPYIIKDQYEKIELSPWMLHSIHHSLESGLEMAKKLVGMLGIDNVKLIKNVPIDQFVKIK